MLLTIPNWLTLARIVAIPLFVVAYFFAPEESKIIPVTIFVLAALTDLLDGYLARKLNKVSQFGAFLDPVADKLMVCTALIVLVSDIAITSYVQLPSCFIIAVIIVVGREISVVAVREWMAEMGDRTSVATSFLSKIKTVSQMVAIIALVYEHEMVGLSMLLVGEFLLYIAAVLTIWTMIQYLVIAWKHLSSIR